MTRAWRIIKSRFAAEAFSGEGARLYGGRWNSPGTAMVYTAGSVSLATLELLVHLDNTSVLPFSRSAPLISMIRLLNYATLPPYLLTGINHLHQLRFELLATIGSQEVPQLY